MTYIFISIIILMAGVIVFLWNRIKNLIVQIEEIIDEANNNSRSILMLAVKTYKKFGVFSELYPFFASIFELFGVTKNENGTLNIPIENGIVEEDSEDNEWIISMKRQS